MVPAHLRGSVIGAGGAGASAAHEASHRLTSESRLLAVSPAPVPLPRYSGQRSAWSNQIDRHLRHRCSRPPLLASLKPATMVASDSSRSPAAVT
jgi:hypothetical protein